MRSTSVLFAMVAVLLVGGAGRLGYLQHCQSEELSESAQEQRTVTRSIPALRGSILDTKGRLLAGSVRRPSVFADPLLLSESCDARYAACSVAPVLGLDAAELESLLRERADDRFVWIKREISGSELEAFTAVRDARKLYAFGVQNESRRTHPHGRLAAHVLGFVGNADEHGVVEGQAGIEQAFNKMLLGTSGRRVSTVDVNRQRLRTCVGEYRAPRDGASVVLTIDAYVQEQTELHLRNAVEDFKAEWGIAVVMDPQSGEILAMATAPDFDPDRPIPGDFERSAAQARRAAPAESGDCPRLRAGQHVQALHRRRGVGGQANVHGRGL